MSDRLEEILNQIIQPLTIVYNDTKNNVEYFPKPKEYARDELKQALQAYIDSKIIEARIDELKKIGIYVPPHSTQEFYYDDRIAELRRLNNES